MSTDRLAASRRIGYLPENGPLYRGHDTAPVAEVFRRGARTRRGDPRVQNRRLIAQCGLDGIIEKPIGKLSKGLRQRVAPRPGARPRPGGVDHGRADRPASIPTRSRSSAARRAVAPDARPSSCPHISSRKLTRSPSGSCSFTADGWSSTVRWPMCAEHGSVEALFRGLTHDGASARELTFSRALAPATSAGTSTTLPVMSSSRCSFS